MPTERKQLLEKLLRSALEHDHSERRAFLDQACCGDESLRKDVSALLAGDEETVQSTEVHPPISQRQSGSGDLRASRAQSTLPIGKSIGRYEVLGVLGEGGMGRVYVARDKSLGRKVALKVLSDDFAEDQAFLNRFQQEAQSASALNHPNIVTVYEVGEADSVHFIAMELIEGETLRQHMLKHRLELGVTLDLAIQVGGALASAHEGGILHRDIKPENIMVRPDGYVKVLDFGLAKRTDWFAETTDAEVARLRVDTEPGIVMGTPKYMSPEQARGLAVDVRTDVFSFGTVLYEMIARTPAFDGTTNIDIILAVLEREPRPLSDFVPGLPTEIEDIVSRAMKKGREQRYQNAGEMVTHLREIRQNLNTVKGLVSTLSAGSPTKSFGRRAHNLPIPPTPLIGREKEVEALERLLLTDVRLLTLIGPGGTGKTRLGLQVATNLLDSFTEGVFFVGLAPISDPALVPTVIAQTMGIKEQRGRPLIEILKEHLRDRRILVVIDNFEQVVSAAPLVAQLLEAAPALRVLVTSRAPLHLRGEHQFEVLPLTLPEVKHLRSVESLLQCAAVALFVQRAQTAKPAFAITENNGPAIANICKRLDGLPLAIELAAARIKLLSPDALLVRLSSRLKLLTGGARDLPARHQTMRSAIAWSYELLDDAEKKLFRRLAVFVGGFTLEAAETVCSTADDLGVTALDGLEALVDASLVHQQDGERDEPRFRMLETIREYAMECLTGSVDADSTRRAHAEFFVAFAETREPLIPSESPLWFGRLEEEQDNFRESLTWSNENREVETGLRLASALGAFWCTRGYLSEGREWFETFLRHAQAAGVRVRSTALIEAATVAFKQADYVRATSLCEQGIALDEVSNDKAGIARSYCLLGMTSHFQREYESAEQFYNKSLALNRELGAKNGIAAAVGNLGILAFDHGKISDAVAFLEEALALSVQLGNKRDIAILLHNLGRMAMEEGDHERATTLYKESYELNKEIGYRLGIAYNLTNLGALALEQAQYETALSLFQQALSLLLEIDHRRGIPECLEGVAEVADALGQTERAIRLIGAAQALRESIDVPVPVLDEARHQRRLCSLRSKLNEEEFHDGLTQGRLMRLTEATSYALEYTIPTARTSEPNPVD